MSKIRGEYKISREQLETMRAAGMGQQAIANALGADPSTVREWLKKFGMPTRLEPKDFTDSEIALAVARWRRLVTYNVRSNKAA